MPVKLTQGTPLIMPSSLLLAAVLAASATDDVIVVTAAREAQPVGATPVAVLDAAELARTGAHHIAEAASRAPGVLIHRGNGAEHLTAIRSPVLTGGAGAGSFLYLEDGVPLRAAGFANVNGLFEAVDELAGGIEVIRGPGPAAYGSNALHGLINVLSQDPATTPSAVELEAGSFGRARLEAQAAGETGFGYAFIGLGVRSEDGWRDDASLLRTAVQTRLDGSLGRADWRFTAALVDLDQETATFIRGFEAYRDEALSRTNPDPEAFRNARAFRAAFRIDQPLTERWRSSVTAYGRTNDMDFRLHFLPSEALETTGHDSLGLQTQFTFEDGPWRVQLGGDAEWTRGELIEDQTRESFGSFPQGLHYDYVVDAAVAAGFANARYQATERVAVEAGARLETTRYDYDTRMPAGQEGRFLRPEDRSDDFTTFAPNLGVTADVTNGVQLFGRIARGVRAPQTAELYRLQPGQEMDGIDPETLDSLEAGVRWTNAAGARIELTGFAMRKENVFFRDADGFNVTDGETTHEGLELDASLPLGERLVLSAAASWAIHEYAFDRVVARSSDVIRDGARVDTAPEWLANLRALWRPTEASSLELEWVHVGEYFTNAANTARYEGHDLLNLRGRIALSERVELFAAVRNLTDARYAERADFAFGSDRYFPGEPRALSAGFRIAR